MMSLQSFIKIIKSRAMGQGLRPVVGPIWQCMENLFRKSSSLFSQQEEKNEICGIDLHEDLFLNCRLHDLAMRVQTLG